ncbi:MAG: oligosaccharide flippase family protein [Candidatus Neomarinimicrobiota bacterium]
MTIRSTIKNFGINSAVYGLGNVLNKLSAFLLIPIYTHYLTLSDVGIITLIELIEVMLITFLPLGTINALWRNLPRLGKSDKKKTIASAFWGIIIIDTAIIALLLINAGPIAELFGLGSDGQQFVNILLVNVFLITGGQFILWMKQYELQPVHYLFLSVGQFLGILLLSILFIVKYNLGIFGYLYGKTIISSILFLTSILFVLRNAFTLPSFSKLIQLMRFGIPLIPIAFVTPILSFSDRYFLMQFVTLEEIGVYGIAYKFGMIVNMLLVVPIQRSWEPLMFRIGGDRQNHTLFKDLLFYFAVIGSLLLLLIIFSSRMLLSVVATDKYLAGAKYIPWVAMAYFINGFRSFFSAGAVLNDRTMNLGRAGLLAVMVNLILNYTLIKYFGVIGAAWSTTISYLVLVLLIFRESQSIMYIDWGFNRLGILFCALLCTILVVLYFQTQFIDINIFIGFIGITIFITSLKLTKIIGDREISGIKQIFKQVFKK